MSKKNTTPPLSPKTRKKKKSSSKSSWKTPLWKRIFKWFFILSIWVCVLSAFVALFFAYDLPDITRLEQSTRQPGVILKAKDGTILAAYGDLYGQTIRVDKLPPHVPNALLAVEDSRFYSHFGVDVLGLIRAFYVNYKAGRVVQGGSTITQQLAKNFLFSEKLYTQNDRSYRRKIQEIILALWLETKFTKKQILTMYLNRVYFGSGTYGISAASQKYFAKQPQNLSVYEAAVIAGLLKAPSRYSPLSDPQRADQRAQIVLDRMVEAGFLTLEQRKALQDSRAQMIQLKKSEVFGRYFADWIMDQVMGYAQGVNEDLVVQTTFDPRLQHLAERYVHEFIKSQGKAKGFTQTALITMTPNGAVRAIVGGNDYRVSQFNRATQALRQPGSTFKLFVFLAALEKGMTLTSKISDEPIRVGKWKPKNYAWTSRGHVSLKDAFAYSVNVCAVRLAKYVGKKTSGEVARRLGISAAAPKDLSFALGSQEVTLLDLTAAYATIANNGFQVIPYGIISIHDRKGNVIYHHNKSHSIRVISKQHLLDLLEMTRAVIAYGTGKKANFGRPVGGKSGTSQNHKDAWFIGFTPDLVAGIWVGNDNGEPMNKVTGGTAPAFLWKNFMAAAHEGYPIHGFPKR